MNGGFPGELVGFDVAGCGLSAVGCALLAGFGVSKAFDAEAGAERIARGERRVEEVSRLR